LIVHVCLSFAVGCLIPKFSTVGSFIPQYLLLLHCWIKDEGVGSLHETTSIIIEALDI
jgi:hypothetical protein